MPIYAAAAIGAVIISTAVMLLLFRKLKLLNVMTLLSVTLASLISIAAFPLMFGLMTGLDNTNADTSPLLQVTVLTAIFCLILAFIFGIIITAVIPKFIRRSSDEAGIEPSEAENQVAAAINENYLEQIYDKLVHENDRETVNTVENADKDENNLEKSVDSSENIDKMGIENIVQDSTIMTIEQCIGEAFGYKQAGDAESAILYFMDALDKKPRKELTFWIVLDICVLYKNLGQNELACDILNSYYDTFGDIMDASIKEEIEINLFDAKA